MQKIKENREKVKNELSGITICSLSGTAAICIACLISAALVLLGIIPEDRIHLYSALACIAGGIISAVIFNKKSRLLIHIPMLTLALYIFIFAVGAFIFHVPFSFSENMLIPVYLFAGVLAGSAAVNVR